MKTTILFSELEKLDDCHSFVWTALAYNPKEKDDIESFLIESGFMPIGSNIKSMQKIGGNALGDNGRSDVLFITDSAHFNHIARLKINGLTWTSDFVINYGKDYGVNAEDDIDDYEDDDSE